MRTNGSALVEWLICVPVLLMLGLGFFQASELILARLALRHALDEAARAGSVANASRESILAGLGDGLAPWRFGANGTAQLISARLRSRAEISLGRAAGWIELRQLSPTQASWSDWGEPARDHQGALIGGQQIAFDALATEYRLRQPNGGASALRGVEPLGPRSQQTLAEANLLTLELVYGVPLRIPFAASAIIAALKRVDGCPASTPSSGATLANTGAENGLSASSVDAFAGTSAFAGGAWACRYYQATDLQGQSSARIPIRLRTTIRMQSPAHQKGSLLEAG